VRGFWRHCEASLQQLLGCRALEPSGYVILELFEAHVIISNVLSEVQFESVADTSVHN
jgi:hypothetical protein